MPLVPVGRDGTAAAAPPFLSAPSPRTSHLVLLFVVLGEAAVEPQREFLELDNDVGIGSVVSEAHGFIQYVLHLEKGLLQIAHWIRLKKEKAAVMLGRAEGGQRPAPPLLPRRGAAPLPPPRGLSVSLSGIRCCWGLWQRKGNVDAD